MIFSMLWSTLVACLQIFLSFPGISMHSTALEWEKTISFSLLGKWRSHFKQTWSLCLTQRRDFGQGKHSLRDKKELSSFLFLFTDTWWCPLLLQSSPGHPTRCPGSDFFPKNLPYHSWRGAEVTQMSKGDPTVSDGWGNSTYPIF